MGTASVTHQIVIKIATPAVNQAVLFNPTGGSVKIKLNRIKEPVVIPNKDILFFANNSCSRIIYFRYPKVFHVSIFFLNVLNDSQDRLKSSSLALSSSTTSSQACSKVSRIS